jgi:hypothetical protein
MRQNNLPFTALIASTALGRAFFSIRIMSVEPLLKNRPENAQGHQAKY